MKIYNAFGITPTNTFVSAGSDYYIPNIIEDKQQELALKAFEKSYGKTKDEIADLYEQIAKKLFKEGIPIYQTTNTLHLYLATDSKSLQHNETTGSRLTEFFIKYFIYDDKKETVGVKLGLNDTLFINSGIKVALDTVFSDKIAPNPSSAVNMFRMLGIGVAGLYVNKSGMGNKGFDVRACLVDEDYAGYVHLSMAFTKDLYKEGKNIVYCGDKLTQMMLIPVFHTEYIETSEEEYNDIMSKSNRGDSGFGSSDIKH
jgi:dUTPase